jgi:holo-ACP synthase CitX
MNIADDILSGREKRSKLIEEYLNSYETIVSIKANMPGLEKNNYLSYLLINAFSFIVKSFPSVTYDYHQNDDGPFVLILLNGFDSKSIKKQMVSIEEHHELGRFIDLDVYDRYGTVTIRDQKRKCIICDNQASICIRNKNHTVEEIFEIMDKKVKMFYENSISQILNQSIMEELELHPKFGLVTPYTSGSHPDMNYELMIKAKEAIMPYLIEMFFETFRNLNEIDLLRNLQSIGKSAETAMFKATEGVNAYKGLIFNLGLIISSIGYKLSRYEKRTIFDISQSFAKQLFLNYDYSSESYGDKAFLEHSLKGIRGEALSGYSTVKIALRKLFDLSTHSKIQTLIFLIINSEDTSLYQRAGSFQKYLCIKKMFNELDLNNDKDVLRINDYCIANNLSFGGSADLLVVTVLIKIFNDIYLFLE